MAPKTLAASGLGTHNHSMLPLGAINAVTSRSAMNP
jgi:hypothetical protein